VLGGQLMAVAIGASSCSWLACVSALPLFLVIRLWRPGRAFFGGALWGFALCACLAALPEGRSAFDLRSAVALTAVPGLYARLGAWLARRIGFRPYVLGLGWAGVELCLAPLGLGTGLLGRVSSEGAVLHWAGTALGYVVVAFLVAFVNASLILLLSRLGVAIRPAFRTVGLASGRRLAGVPASRFISAVCLFDVQPRAPPIHIPIH
jgi:hypothetical protein